NDRAIPDQDACERKEINMASNVQTTRTLAQIAGPYMALLGLALAVRHNSIKVILHDLEQSPAVMFSLGLVTLLIGLIMLVLHHSWRTAAEIVISLLGLLITVRGAILLAAPEMVSGMMRQFEGYATLAWLSAAVTIILGGWLIYEGYLRNWRERGARATR